MVRNLIRITHLSAPVGRSLFLFTAVLLVGCGGAPAPSSDPVDATGGSSSPVSTPVASAPVAAPPATNTSASSKDTTRPTVSISAPKTGATVSGTITLSATATDPTVSRQTTSGIAGVQFMFDGVNLGGEDTTFPYSVSGDTRLFANGTHALTAVARDKAGNKTTSVAVSVQVSNTVATPVPDTASPSIPTSIGATVISSGQIALRWNASTDNVGVTGYKVFRNGSHLAIVTGTSYQDNGLVAKTTYTYTIQAYDASGNTSALSAGASAITLAVGAETSLSTLAASMQPGTWAELTTTNLVPTVNSVGNCATGSILPYTEEGQWDPVSQQLIFYGGDHPYDDSCAPKFIAYSASTNAWRVMPNPPFSYLGHAYNFSATPPQGGAFYFITNCCSTQSFWKYDIATGTWTQRASVSTIYNFIGALEPAPNPGEFMAVTGDCNNGSGCVWLYKESTNQWSTLASSGMPMGSYQNIARYNPVHKVVLFGGGSGSSDVYKLDAAGKVTRLTNAPFELNVNGTSLVTVDPVTGDYLVFGGSQEFYTYNILTNQWTRKAGTIPIYNPDPGHGPFWKVIASPIAMYGVTLFIKHSSSSDARVYLYKHVSP